MFIQKQPPDRPARPKKVTLAQMFSCEFCEISKNTCFTEHLWAAASESNRSISIKVSMIWKPELKFLLPPVILTLSSNKKWQKIILASDQLEIELHSLHDIEQQ